MSSVQPLLRLLACCGVLWLFAACQSVPGGNASGGAPGGRAVEQDGPPQIPHGDLTQIPDPIPRQEPKSNRGNPDSYEVFGKRYRVMASAAGYRAEGNASWYGQKFHGRTTSSGEPFDMFGLTAAHRSLPIPSYAQVTNLTNGHKVMVRINDRGPFHKDRILDLSYAAAVKLDFHDQGTARVLVEVVAPALDDDAPLTANATLKAPNRVATDPAPPLSMAGTTGPLVPIPQPKYAPGFSLYDQVNREQASPADQAAGNPAGAGTYLQAGAFRLIEGAGQVAAQIRQQLNSWHASPVPVTELVLAKTSGLYLVRIGPVENRAAAEQVRQRLIDNGFAPPLILP